MGSITTWARLEPHARTSDMTPGLEMRVHDPLWMLARQWQFGEFQGEDTGSPVWASLTGARSPIALYLPGPLEEHRAEDVLKYSRERPLELIVEDEREPAIDVMQRNRRLAVEAGQQFLRLLGPGRSASARTVLLQRHAVAPLKATERATVDPDSVAFIDLAAGRAVDGALLLDTVRDKATDEATVALGFQGADVRRVGKVLDAWLSWCERTIGPLKAATSVRSAWNAERMEYSCAIAAPGDTAGAQTVLVAREYTGDGLDWYSFDAVPGARLQDQASTPRENFALATLPTNLSFRGLPANRLWEFEDAQVRFGSIEAAPTDLARLLLVEFLTQYGNDFFAIPIDLEAGALVEITTLTITNTFGDAVPASPFADKDWRLFALSDDPASTGARTSALLLPSVLGPHLVSAPIERVHLVRDEIANVAWAIEEIVESRTGAAMNRHEAHQAERQRERAAGPPKPGTLTYRLDTWESTLPDFWIPLLPESVPAGQPRRRLTCYDSKGRSRGRFFFNPSSSRSLSLFDEEVPRAGAQLTRRHQYSRWYGGGVFAWISREKTTGHGSSSSGLRHDAVEIASEP
jgi:hypothetical protein